MANSNSPDPKPSPPKSDPPRPNIWDPPSEPEPQIAGDTANIGQKKQKKQ